MSENKRKLTEAEIEADELDSEEDAEEEATGSGYTAGKGRATVGRRNRVEEEEQGVVGGLQEYFVGVRSELQKVAWPERAEALRLTRVVVWVVVLASLLLGGLSFFFTILFGLGAENPLAFTIIIAVLAPIAYFGFMYVWKKYLSTSDEETSYTSSRY